jgi:hypothetical protein
VRMEERCIAVANLVGVLPDVVQWPCASLVRMYDLSKH